MFLYNYLHWCWVTYEFEMTRCIHVTVAGLVLGYIRTCSTSFNLLMTYSMVCMHESRTGRGELCFCDWELCNSAPSTLAYVTRSSDNDVITSYVVRRLADFLAAPIVTLVFSRRYIYLVDRTWLVASVVQSKLKNSLDSDNCNVQT